MRTLVEQVERKDVLLWLLRLGLAASNDDTPERAKVDEQIAQLSGEDARRVRTPLQDGTRQVAIETFLVTRLSPASRLLLAWLAEHSPIVLMGGEALDARRRSWDLYPERPAVIVGTQDMLLSRALNRGYGMSRYRWPMHFGLLNADCLWVLDEVQIMSSGLTTSLQLQAWREQLALQRSDCGEQSERTRATLVPAYSWWMSATSAEHWFKKSVAMRSCVEALWRDRLTLDRQKEPAELFTIPKTLHRAPIDLRASAGENDESVWAKYANAVAKHLADSRSRTGKRWANDTEETEDILTLMICNTVERAVAVYRALRALRKNASQDALFDDDHLLLLHSRFRGHERVNWPDKLKAFEKGGGHHSGPRIIVATQVIEAGVDISASVLYTELCPLASLIQRLGRCARRAGDSGQAFWIDFSAFGADDAELSPEHAEAARPYEHEEIVASRKVLADAESRAREAGAAASGRLPGPSHA
jgi:CRISPR-associated endonuclease/helicase Cas3